MEFDPGEQSHSALRSVTELLDELQRRWALVGGLAVSSRAEPRFTRDIDLAVAVDDDADAELLVHGLTSRGYSSPATVEQKRVGRLATIRLRAPGDTATVKGVVVDLLFASSGIEDLIVEGAERICTLSGLSMPVAKVGHLLAMKVLAHDRSRRPQDLMDISALLAEATEQDVSDAEHALQLITQRGFNRQRNLIQEWKKLRTQNAARR